MNGNPILPSLKCVGVLFEFLNNENVLVQGFGALGVHVAIYQVNFSFVGSFLVFSLFRAFILLFMCSEPSFNCIEF